MYNSCVRLVALFLMVLALTNISLTACEFSGSVSKTDSNGSSPKGASSTVSSYASIVDVYMSDSRFLQSTVTIKKGGSINLVDDSPEFHIIQNGTWKNGTAQAIKESDAPTVQQSYNGSDSHIIGPFSTSGTFRLYCTIHTDMNLTVTVQ